MPRPALKCRVKLRVKQISCPGTLHLTDRNLVFITVSVLAQTIRTKSVFASFPFVFNEKLVFERIFTNARTLNHLLEILEDEIISIELRQYSERYDDGKILAKFEQSSRQFLFPAPSFAPKDDINREVLLMRTSNYPIERGIDPQLSFSTNTKIEETNISSSSRDHLSKSRASTIHSPPKSKQQSSKRSPLANSASLSSETEEEAIITTPRKGIQLRDGSMQYQHCVCECRNRLENHGRFVIRSRSVSPGRSSPKRTPHYKPPFKVGKAPQNLISRRHFDESPSSRYKKPLGDENSFPCSNCLVPHPDCSMCMAYKSTYGSDFLRHRFAKEGGHVGPKSSPNPVPHNRQFSKSKPKVPRARARIPVVSSPESSDSEDRYRAALNVSSERKHNRSKMFGEAVEAAANSGAYVRSAVKDLLRKNDSVLQYELTDSELENSLMSDISDAEIDNAALQNIVSSRKHREKELPDRSVVVPLSEGRYWSQRSQQFTGKSHRHLFNDSLSEIYKDLYRKAVESD